MARNPYLSPDEQLAQSAAGVPIPDGSGRIVKNGVIVSAADAAASQATTAQNAARQTGSSQITGSGPIQTTPITGSAPIQTGQIRSSGPIQTSPIGNSPVARAIQANFPGVYGQQPGAPSAAPSAPAQMSPDVNSYTGSRYDPNFQQNNAPTAMPGAPTPGVGIQVTGYSGSRYDPNFAANNPGPRPLEANEVTMARQLLGMNDGVDGRNYKAGNMANATPQQILNEAALLPIRQQRQAGQINAAAARAAISTMGQPPAGAQVDPVGALNSYIREGGTDPKMMEMFKQAGIEAAKFNAPAKPQPGSQGYSTITLPGGGTVVRDNATGAPLSAGDIQKPDKPEKAPKGKDLTDTELKRITAVNQSRADLDALEKQFNSYQDTDFGGPIAGRVSDVGSRLVGQGPSTKVNAIDNLVDASVPNLARGVFGEVGVLTDDDVKRYRGLVPNAYDTPDIRAQKFAALRDRLKTSEQGMYNDLKDAGRDVSGFDKRMSPADAKPALDVNDPAVRAAASAALAERRAKMSNRGTSTTK